MASLVSSVSTLVESGLRGPRSRAAARSHSRSARWGLFLALWSALAGIVVLLRLFNPIFLPGPWLVLGSLVELAVKGQLWGHVAATLERVAVGFRHRRGARRDAGLAAGYLVPVRNMVEPLVELLRPIPPLALLPMFIVWVGIGETSKVGFITYATFFPIFLTTVTGVRQIDPLLLRAAQSLGARGLAIFTRVILPAALPDILTGLRLGVALAFFVIVISEFIGAEQGLGYLINDGRNFFLVRRCSAPPSCWGCWATRATQSCGCWSAD